jgi:hypothetical protein
VSHGTINNDLRGQNCPPSQKDANETKSGGGDDGQNYPPVFDGGRAAQLVLGRESGVNAREEMHARDELRGAKPGKSKGKGRGRGTSSGGEIKTPPEKGKTLEEGRVQTRGGDRKSKAQSALWIADPRSHFASAFSVGEKYVEMARTSFSSLARASARKSPRSRRQK